MKKTARTVYLTYNTTPVTNLQLSKQNMTPMAATEPALSQVPAYAQLKTVI